MNYRQKLRNGGQTMLNRKVIVDIKNPEIFTERGFNNMNHKKGTVIDIMQKNIDKGIYEDKVLIKFDTPADKLYKYGFPIECFWFRKSDLN